MHSPGSSVNMCSREEAIGNIARGINQAHERTRHVTIVLENMAGQAPESLIGSRFEDLSEIIDIVHDKTRVGVCFDTCHAFAAGYDIRSAESWNETMAEFDRVVGLKYLKAFHLNDSKGPLGCHRDRHENLGKGVTISLRYIEFN
jgi:AP endonuclease-1